MKLDLNNFILFIGHCRSGTSAVAAIIDSHPNAICSHEIHCLQNSMKEKWSKNKTIEYVVNSSQEQAKKGRRSGTILADGCRGDYNHKIEGQLKDANSVIYSAGDKLAGKDNSYLHKVGINALVKFKDKIGLPLKIIHMVRNPYDIIALERRWYGIMSLRYRSRKRKQKKINYWVDVLKRIEGITKAVKNIDDKDISVCDIYLDTLVNDPNSELKKLFSFLDLPISENVMNKCKNHLNFTPHQRRFEIQWGDTKKRVEKEIIEEFEWFNKYEFEK